MAAESSENRNVRMMGAEMHRIAEHITIQMHYINDELLLAIQSEYIRQIKASTNQEEKDRIAKMGEEEKRKMEETLFNGYNNLLIAINNLLAIKRNRNSAKIMAPVLDSLKMRLRDLDRLLKQYRDVYKPRGRLMHNKLESHVVSPINTSKSYVHVPNHSPKQSSLRGSRNVSRGRISINPMALVGETYHKSNIKGFKHPSDPSKNEPGMVHSDQEIKQMKKKALQNLINRYTAKNEVNKRSAIRRFKLEMRQTNKLQKEVEANQAEFNAAERHRKTLKRKYENI